LILTKGPALLLQWLKGTGCFVAVKGLATDANFDLLGEQAVLAYMQKQ
jgi:hypothetical protein